MRISKARFSRFWELKRMFKEYDKLCLFNRFNVILKLSFVSYNYIINEFGR